MVHRAKNKRKISKNHWYLLKKQQVGFADKVKVRIFAPAILHK